MNNGFKEFSKKIHSRVNKITNFTGKFLQFRQPEVFFTVKDGLWTDPTIWTTVGGRIGKLPGARDDVYIKHTVSLVATVFSVFNLHVSGTLNFTGGDSLSVLGDIKVENPGTLNLVASNVRVLLFGFKNRIDNFQKGSNTGSYISYAATQDGQEILNLDYGGLNSQGGLKVMRSNLVVTRNLSMTAPLQVDFFDLTVQGTSNFNGIHKHHGGKLLFIGLAGFGSNAHPFYTHTINFPGNPEVEFRGGFQLYGYPTQAQFYTGTGQWRFTTNNQNIIASNAATSMFWDCEVVIEDSITLGTVGVSSWSIFLQGTINATTSSGKLILNNLATFNYHTLISVTNSWVTGIFDRTTLTGNTVGYTGNYSATLPYADFQNLAIAGTGVKTQMAGTNTIIGSLSIAAGARLDSGGNTTVGTTSNIQGTIDMTAYNWIYTGVTTMGATSVMLKTGAGTVLFIGQLSGDANTPKIDFTGGNPTVEFRNGFIMRWTADSRSGTGDWLFTTNNQTVNTRDIFAGAFVIERFIVQGAITVNNNSPNSPLRVNFLDGTDPASILLNTTTLFYMMDFVPMPTAGIVDRATVATNTIGYMYTGNGTIPYTTYKGLWIGQAGIKTLSGDTVLGYNLRVGTGQSQPYSELQCSSYALTVGGSTVVDNAILSKNSATGGLLFIGIVSANGLGGGAKLNFSGNPNVECRGGLYIGNVGSGSSYTTGTGVWTFSTNNQTIQVVQNLGLNDMNILISGAITLTHTMVTAADVLRLLSLNGNNALSKFDARYVVHYFNATQPMATGVLETNAAANTWFYNLAGDQDVKGGTYRTLTLAGSGVKTLQGNVVVVTTYTLTAPATLNLNGYTRT